LRQEYRKNVLPVHSSVVVKVPSWSQVYVTVSVKPAEHVKTSVEAYA
jgi:hypothetical protein